MDRLWLDLETRSTVDIKAGTDRYADVAEIDVCAWAWNDEPAEVLDVVRHGFINPQFDTLHERVRYGAPFSVIAHNAFFDRTLINRCWPALAELLPLEVWRCSMALALSHSLPGGLGPLGEVFGMADDAKKDKRGGQLMRLFCKPNKEGLWNTWETHPKERAEYLEYGRQDVVAMRALIKKIPQWNYVL